MCWHFYQIISMLISKQDFLSVKLTKKSKYPMTFKFVFITNGAQFSAEECWFLPYLGQHLTSQQIRGNADYLKFSILRHQSHPLYWFLFKIKFSIIIKQDSDTWKIKLVCQLTAIQ